MKKSICILASIVFLFLNTNLFAQEVDTFQIFLKFDNQKQLAINSNNVLVANQKDSKVEPGEWFKVSYVMESYVIGNPDQKRLYTISTTNQAGKKVYLAYDSNLNLLLSEKKPEQGNLWAFDGNFGDVRFRTQIQWEEGLFVDAGKVSIGPIDLDPKKVVFELYSPKFGN